MLPPTPPGRSSSLGGRFFPTVRPPVILKADAVAEQPGYGRPVAPQPERDALLWVLGSFAVCWCGILLWVHHYAISLPHADEYTLVSVACGQEPVTFHWLCATANEHRTPLLRLYILVLGELSHWDFRVILKANAILLGLGVFSLLLAVRQMRGRSAISDCFLSLVLLSPSLHETIVLFSFAYTPALAWLCMALALVVNGAIYRSRLACACYGALGFCVLLGGGPAGELWFMGMLSVVPFLWVRQEFKRFRYLVLLYALAGSALTALLVLSTPHVAGHEIFRARSTYKALEYAVKYAAGWLGNYPLWILWPYPLFVLLVPAIYLLFRTTGGVNRIVRKRSLSADDAHLWVPLAALLGATLVLTLILGQKRGIVNVWVSRYHCMIAPIGVLIYLLLVRFRAPRALPEMLAALMLLCYGWTWQGMLASHPAFTPPARRPLIIALRNGSEPLSLLVQRHSGNVAMPPSWNTQLLDRWLSLQERKLSVFHKMHRNHPRSAFPASTGELGPGVEVLAERDALRGKAVTLSDSTQTGCVIYHLHLPAKQRYQVWVRCRAVFEDAILSARVDEGPTVEAAIEESPGYGPKQLLAGLTLEPGEHTLEIGMSGIGVRIDLVEVVREP